MNFMVLALLQVLIGIKVLIKVIFKLTIVKLVIGDLIMILKARSKRLKFFLEKELSLFQCLAVIATVTTDV